MTKSNYPQKRRADQERGSSHKIQAGMINQLISRITTCIFKWPSILAATGIEWLILIVTISRVGLVEDLRAVEQAKVSISFHITVTMVK